VSNADTDSIEKAAADWLAKRDSERWTAADQTCFDQWLAASTLNRVTYLRLEHVWEEARRLKAFGAGIVHQSLPPTGHLFSWFHREHNSRSTGASSRRQQVWLSTAVAAVGIAWLAYLLAGTFLAERRYSTPPGRVSSISLRDGSRVTLNTDTGIRATISRRERSVQLERGEAFFEVAKDLGRTFVVGVGNKRVIAVGTKFSVRRDTGSVQVVVTEGRVWIETNGGAPELTQLLRAGSVARTNDSGTQVETRSLPEAGDYIAWIHGVLVFHDATLADAAREFNRYNRRTIVIGDPSVGEFRIAGAFRWSNVDGFVRLLEQGYPIRALRTEREIILER
jgi:transmembrane sensor